MLSTEVGDLEVRLALERFKRGFTIHHGRLRTRLMSIRSLLHYLSYQIYDRGITLTPSYVRKKEVLKYLVDTYGSNELEPIKSYSFGTYEVDNYLMLELGSMVTKNEDLKRDLDLLASYYKTRKTEENISSYLSKKQSLKGNVKVKPFAKFEYGRVKFRGVNDLSYSDNYYTVGNAKEIYVSHIFYDALADYAGIEKNDEWTFRSELTRDQEDKFILLVLEGSLQPNTEVGKRVHKEYLKVITDKTPNIIFQETFYRRMEEIDAITERILNEGKQLKGVTDYSVIYEDNGDEITHVPVYAGYYVWDHDYDRPLDDVNRLRGIGGEFTREVKPGRLPYEVYVNGKLTEMYPVEIEEVPKTSNSLIETLEEEFEGDQLGHSNGKRNRNRNDYLIRASDLVPRGFAYVGDDDYIRVLNATDLELNGDVCMYYANMFPKLNFKSQKRSVEKYEQLKGSEEDLELHVKTVVDEDDDMYVKLHLKYYAENSNNEQVVEGLIMLNEDLKVPNLYTVLSGETILPITSEDLKKKRIGVYVKEKESMYAYKFLVMFNTKSNKVIRITDDILGVDRRGRVLHSLPLSAFGLEKEKEDLLAEMVRKEVVNKVIETGDSKFYYKELLLQEV